jgi:hypothetical protein
MRGDEGRVIAAFCEHLREQGWTATTEVAWCDVRAERDGAVITPSGEQVHSLSQRAHRPPPSRPHSWHLFRIRRAPLQREIAGEQLTRQWPHHLERRPWGEAGPAMRQHRAITTQLTPVGVVITQRPQVPGRLRAGLAICLG